MCMFALMTALSLMSCDDDADLAYDLNGIWEGTIQGEYYYNRHHSRATRWETQIQFVQDGDFSRGGYGVEFDYNYDTGYGSWSEFDWKVRDGRIYIYYYSDDYEVVIRDYELYTMLGTPRFRGYFVDRYTGEDMAAFTLVKTSDWTDYAKKNKATFDD